MALGDNMGAAPNMGAVNPFKYPTEKCECGCNTFIPALMFFKIPGVMVGQGGDTAIYPHKVFVCSKCGELSPSDKELMSKADGEKKEESNKSGLII